ncbi:hypothetical protein [Rugamonas sp.]|uniref:hypothetical protein n=1 Tax=Rugamonas sp. TaxID=1926287 RepID=UPI0026008E3A|nr:hypothetical protein [Rugamonas sp.]
MSDAMTEYQEAYDANQSATAECNAIAATIKSAGAILKDWKVATMDNIEINVPGLLFENPHMRIDARKWPTAAAIASALTNYHATKREENVKYNALPLKFQKLINPPTN